MSVLKGSNSFYSYDASDIIQENIKQWLNYGLVEKGAYTNIQETAANSGYSYLQRVSDSRYGDFKVYEGLGPSWVWESGISQPQGLQAPSQVSGVTLDGVFTPVGSGYTVDYRYGRIIFDNATSGVVTCNYSMRDVLVETKDSITWDIITEEYSSAYQEAGDLSPSGIAQRIKEKRVWLPCVIVDVQESTMSPLQLGGGEIQEFTVFYHIFSDNDASAKRLVDLITNQYSKRVNLYNVNQSTQLDFTGDIASGAKTYLQLAQKTSPEFWTFGYIDNSRGRFVRTEGNISRGEVQHEIQVERYLSTY